jgi:hypothetical protein
MQTPESVLRTYFRAKDENRPHLIGRAFTLGAVLEIRNKASSIEFPALDGLAPVVAYLSRGHVAAVDPRNESGSGSG